MIKQQIDEELIALDFKAELAADEGKTGSQFQEETVRIYTGLTHRVKPQRPDLVIWPETATPFFFQSAYPFQSRILELTHQLGVPILFGAPAFERDGPRINYFNSAFLISPEKKILGRYDKIHLVPFGEYAPLSGILGFTRDIIGAIGEWKPTDFSSFSLFEGLLLAGLFLCLVRPLAVPWTRLVSESSAR
jgi:apolipoprotein N-acyltransferase